MLGNRFLRRILRCAPKMSAKNGCLAGLMRKEKKSIFQLVMFISFPILITNFKTYESAAGKSALTLAKIHEKIAKEFNVNFACAVQACDIRLVSSAVKIPILAQHFDLAGQGKFTGFTPIESLKQAGAIGSLLNHAEHKISFEILEKSIIRAKELDFFTVVCAKDEKEALAISKLKPDCIAVEPPELIGGDISVSTASPDIIKKSVSLIKDIPVIVGAGIKTAKDIKIALKLGAKGILLASGVTEAKDKEVVLREFAKAML